MQVTPANPMTGLEGRATLLANLSKALKQNPIYFGADARPGNLIGNYSYPLPFHVSKLFGTADYLESQSIVDASNNRKVHISALWHVLIEGLQVIWPASRTQLGGVPLGDVWPCNALKTHAAKPFTEGDELVPFHKLTGWTTYSLLEPLQHILKWQFEGLEDLTGLPEYRNGLSLFFILHCTHVTFVDCG